MKYIYKILRLFFCPHKWTIDKDYGTIRNGGVIAGHYYIKECQYCHKVRNFNCK